MRESLFNKAYGGDQPLFGATPTAELVHAVESLGIGPGKALDVGCGDGRDTFELLRRGFDVTAIDRSPSAVEALKQRAVASKETASLKLSAVCADFRDALKDEEFILLNAVTLLDHLPKSEISAAVHQLAGVLAPGGLAVIQVLTVDDPAVTRHGDVSEFASEIHHYFEHNELLRLLQPLFRVVLYQERMEWDYDHGEPHQHGMAIFVGLRLGQGETR